MLELVQISISQDAGGTMQGRMLLVKRDGIFCAATQPWQLRTAIPSGNHQMLGIIS